MKCYDIRLNLPKNAKYAELAVICCLHIGHKQHDHQRALRWRSWILSDKRRFCFDLGDDAEAALPGDEKHSAMTYDSNMTPEDQLIKVKEFLQPLAEKRKIIVSHDSNHWARFENKTGISMAKDVNVFLQNQYDQNEKEMTQPHPDKLPRWGHWQSLTKLHVGRQSYTIHSWHGAGGGATPESALRKCRSMAVQHHADIYCMGHFHQKVCWQDSYMQFSSNGMDSLERQRTFACTGSFLGWHTSYAEKMGLPPNRRGAIVLKLGAKEWDVKVGL